MYNQGKIMRRLLGRPENGSPADGSIGVTSSPLVSQAYRPNASQDAAYPSTVPIACLDRSPDGQTAVLGGRHILKTIHIDGLDVKEGVDVRSAITAQFANKSNAASLIADQLSIKDAKFSSNHGNEPAIFTACANGKIFMYDISRLGSGTGLDLIQTCEGSRQVNKLDFNPHRGTWMLSGGQDGIVRCFDVKAPVVGRTGPTFRTFQALRCNADGVRDVKWAPKDGMIFACATESGVVLKWDIRKHNAPLLKINAHDTQKGVSSISWHPDGDHLISSGLDGKCHVWDLSKNAEKRQKPRWTINAPAPVTSVSWRPGLWSATAQGRRAAQVAVSYDEGGNLKKYGISSVHVWDLARPTMPYKEIDMFKNSPYGLLWHDQDLLWTAGQDGFTQCDVAFAPKVMDRQPLSSLDFSARGDVLMFLEERVEVPRPRPIIMAHEVLPTSSYSSSPTGQMLSISRSDSEEDVIGAFLGPKRRANHKRRISNRPPQTLSSTPPSGPGVEDQTIALDQAIKLTSPFKPQQVMAIGHVPAAPKTHMYQFLSQQYLEVLQRHLPCSDGTPLDTRIASIMEHYARAAETVSQFRLAQTWRILSYAMSLLLTRRSQYHLEVRSTRRVKKKSPKLKDTLGAEPRLLVPETSPSLHMRGEETPRRPQSVTSSDTRQTSGRSLLAEEIDSESNVPTPLARPVEERTTSNEDSVTGKKLTPVQELESFTLPPAIHSGRPSPRRRLDSAPLSIMSQDSQLSSTEGYDFYDLEAVENLPNAIDVPKKKEPLTLDYVEPKTPNDRRRAMGRHDSDESFAQMFSLSDASRQTSVLTSSSGGSARQMARRHQESGITPETNETEYGSRIRGKQISDSPRVKYVIRRPPERHDSGLTEDFMVSQTTTDTLDSDPSHEEEDRSPVRLRARTSIFSQNISQARLAAERPEDHASPTITETDFLPWTDDPPYPHPITSDTNRQRSFPPIDPYDILSRALAFETKHSPVNASAMILLLKPLVPQDVINSYQAAAILRQHHKRLMDMRFFVEAALLRNLCVPGWADGIELLGDSWASIFAPAQDRVAVGFACAQCHKPREIERSVTEGSGIWKCERCRAVVAPCAVCDHRDATADPPPPAPVSEAIMRPSPISKEPMLSTWWYCPGCSHGGHASCLQDWHAPIAPVQAKDVPISGSPTFPDGVFPETNSDGCCPLDGCGHACLPGKWRNETSTARTEELGRVVREQTRGTVTGLKKSSSRQRGSRDALSSATVTPAGSVRGDSIEVPQSRAVESVRETLSTAASTGSNGGSEREGRASGGLMSSLSSSPGRGSSVGAGVDGRGLERERRKSVKFVGPGPPEDRR